MPIFEFRCAECDHLFDRLLPHDAPIPTCPACGGEEVRRLISQIGGLGGGREIPLGSVGRCGGCGGACACAN